MNKGDIMKEAFIEKYCKELQDERFNLYCNYNQNNEDLEQFKSDFNLDSDVTGLIGEVQNGEVIELWATDDNIPWELRANFIRVI